MMRLFNFRPFFVSVIGIILGVLISESIFEGVVYYLYTFFLFCAIAVVYILVRSKGNFKEFARNKISISICIIIICCSIGFVVGYNSLSYYNKERVFEGSQNISARVYKVNHYDNSTKILLENVVVFADDRAVHISEYIGLFTVADFDDVDVGDIVSFTAYLNGVDLFVEGKLNTALLLNNIFYQCYVEPNNLDIKDGEKTVFEKFKDSGKTILSTVFSGDELGICFAVIFGDSSQISQQSYSYFKDSGIAHILAVSGLHISLLAGAVWFVINKLKISKVLKNIFIILFLFFYCSLCGFSSSVVRASIMFFCLIFGKLLGERTDGLSSLSFAAVLILLFKPLAIYELGFQLSFLSVFGIIGLYPTIMHFLSKIKMNNPIGSSLAITLSATLATLPVCINAFGAVPLATFVSNLLVLPLFTFFYFSLVVAFILNLVFGFLNFIFYIPKLMLTIVLYLAKLFATFGVIIFKPMCFDMAFGYEISLFASSKFMIIDKNYKICFIMLSICCILLYI